MSSVKKNGKNKSENEKVASKLLIDIVALALAINQVCDTWFNGSIFAGTRAYLEVWQDVESSRYIDRIRRFFANLLSCQFCLSHHIMFFLVVICWLPTLLADVPPWSFITMLPVYGLAALRLSLLLDEVTSN